MSQTARPERSESAAASVIAWSSSRASLLVLRLVLAGLLFGLVLRKAPLAKILAAISTAAPLPLLLGCACGILFTSLKVFRWRWFLGRLGVACTLRDALHSYFGGLAVGLITPGRVGEVARSLYLPSGDRAYLTGAAFLDKLFDLLVIILTGAMGCAVQGFAKTALLLLLGACAIATLFFLPGRATSKITRRVPLVRSVIEATARPIADAGPATFGWAFLQAVGTFGVAVVQFRFFLSAFVTAPLVAAFFVFPLMTLSNLIPITISGVGVREWASIILFSVYGVSAPIAVNVALLLYLCNSLGPGLPGILCAPRWKAPAPGAVVEQHPEVVI